MGEILHHGGPRKFKTLKAKSFYDKREGKKTLWATRSMPEAERFALGKGGLNSPMSFIRRKNVGYVHYVDSDNFKADTKHAKSAWAFEGGHYATKNVKPIGGGYWVKRGKSGHPEVMSHAPIIRPGHELMWAAGTAAVAYGGYKGYKAYKGRKTSAQHTKHAKIFHGQKAFYFRSRKGKRQRVRMGRR